MKNPKADLILHPVRMRILMAVVNRPMTAGQIAEVLTDVAQATLYRHIKLLADAGLLSVVEERPTRGTVEKVYALNQSGASLGPEEATQLSREDHRRYFVMFVTTLIGDFERYLQQETIEIAKEVSYHKFPLYASDEELTAVSNTINEALLPLLSNPPGSGRQRRIIASILLPDADEPDAPTE
jgi:DNA-binding transcriptional ArsR family regulator